METRFTIVQALEFVVTDVMMLPLKIILFMAILGGHLPLLVQLFSLKLKGMGLTPSAKMSSMAIATICHSSSQQAYLTPVLVFQIMVNGTNQLSLMVKEFI